MEAQEEMIDEKKSSGKKDACYHKVKARYDVWPSAYASGALVKCRKVGAANWGNKSKKKNEIKDRDKETLIQKDTTKRPVPMVHEDLKNTAQLQPEIKK